MRRCLKISHVHGLRDFRPQLLSTTVKHNSTNITPYIKTYSIENTGLTVVPAHSTHVTGKLRLKFLREKSDEEMQLVEGRCRETQNIPTYTSKIQVPYEWAGTVQQ